MIGLLVVCRMLLEHNVLRIAPAISVGETLAVTREQGLHGELYWLASD